MRVKVESDEGELLALLAVEGEDPNGIVGWKLYLRDREYDGNIWARGSRLQDAGHALDIALKAHRG